jgi:hypothetical protein
MRFGLEVIDAVREAMGDMPLIARAFEAVHGGDGAGRGI